jgi:hypothetical protein
MPKNNSTSKVSTTETAMEPRQPKRLEKNRNMFYSLKDQAFDAPFFRHHKSATILSTCSLLGIGLTFFSSEKLVAAICNENMKEKILSRILQNLKIFPMS